ncbi:MAG: hypothetical protein GEU73_05125 [Chloroflexi bacterium]|nr:hypothetical protein [Chloroflexota bacterium]
MANPLDSRRSSGGGRYYVWASPDGEVTERYWSVTTIIEGGIPKPALMGWGIKMTAIGAIKHHDKIDALICDEDLKDSENWGEDGKPTTAGARAAYKFLWDYRFSESERAAKLGTKIHEAIEAYELDKPAPEWPEDVAPFMDNAVDFLRSFEVMVEMSEASVFNRTQRYAGTLDCIATINGERWLLDFKTGKGVYPEAALQMSAYAHAEFIGSPDKTEAPMPKIDHAAIVHLRPEGFKFTPVDIGEHVYNSFLYAREVFRWQQEISKKAVGDPIPSLDVLAPAEVTA